MQLNRGAEVEYRQRHSPIWQELEEVLRSHGVHNYSIFLHPETGQLFAYAEIEDEARWNAIAQTPARVDKGNLRRQDIVRIRPNGEQEGTHPPSSESPFHLSVYEVDAFDRLEVLEATAAAIIRSRALGSISAMGPEVIQELLGAFPGL